MDNRTGEATPAARAATPAPRRWDPARLKARLLALGPWRGAGAAVILGALATLALPPFEIFAVLLVSFGGLLWLLEGRRSLRGAAALGWAFGFGYFLAGTYWIGESFLVDAERFGALAVPAVVGLAAGLALFPAVATALALPLSLGPLSRVIALSVTWTAAEWLRGHVLTGFPWNLVGSAWSFSEETLQAAAFVGVYGLSFLAMLAAGLPVLSAEPGRRGLRRWWPALAALLLVAGLWSAGAARLPGDGGRPATPALSLRIVQGNVEQAMKWKPEERERILARYLELSTQPGGDPDLVIWPETALPYLITEGARFAPRIAEVVPRDGFLLTGVVRRTGGEAGDLRIWNSLIAIDPAGEIAAAYDKAHLVPFGEYMPLRDVLPFGKLTAGSVDFSAGPGPRTLALPGVPGFSPLICYEAIFPGEVTAPGSRPAWLLNVTNDAWFGESIGPYQHLQAARMRAVEEGLPLVRAANTGISAVVDPYGRILAQLGLNRQGVIDAELPAPLSAPTVYARYGDLPLAVVVAIVALLLFAGRMRAAKPTNRG